MPSECIQHWASDGVLRAFTHTNSGVRISEDNSPVGRPANLTEVLGGTLTISGNIYASVVIAHAMKGATYRLESWGSDPYDEHAGRSNTNADVITGDASTESAARYGRAEIQYL